MKNLTLGSLFDGIGGFPFCAELSGIKPVWAAEVDAACVAVTKQRFPDMQHYGDVSKINGADLPPVDIITFGSPCFPAGTLVLTSCGQVPIEDVTVGMTVLTHTGRWRTVTATGSKRAETVVLKGNHYGLECTPNHPIYSADSVYKYQEKNHTVRTIRGEKKWTPAGEMLGKFWCVPRKTDRLAIDLPRYTKHLETNENFYYFIGRWIGSGWLRNDQICLCDSLEKEGVLVNVIEKLHIPHRVVHCSASVRVEFSNQPFANWLRENFGERSYEKKLSSWVYSLPLSHQEALLKGYIDSDGCQLNDNTWRISTTSKQLVIGMRILGEMLGYSTSIFFTKVPETRVIVDHVVKQRDIYTLSLNKPKRMTRLTDELHTWYRVRNVTSTNETKTVYNLTVRKDNSYVADGIVVHNCQDLSVAGKQTGIKNTAANDEETTRSGLFIDAIRIVYEMREATNGEYPKHIVWENVPGAFTSNHGRDFQIVLEEITKARIPMPGSWRWANAGMVRGDGITAAWRVLDAQYWGVPQRRKRIYLVGSFGNDSAAEILFKPDSVQRYLTPSGTQGSDVGRAAPESVKGSERILTYGFPLGFQPANARLYEETATTLCSGTRPGFCNGVMYALDYASYNSGKNAQYSFGSSKNGINSTLVAKGPSVVAYCLQGSMIGREDKNGPQGSGVNKDVSFTLSTADRHAVAYKWCVRRLTPKECERLQGYPDEWTVLKPIESMTDEEYEFYKSAYLTNKQIKGITVKNPPSKEQLIKWHNKLDVDGTRYKQLGNSLAIPCALRVIGYIADHVRRTTVPDGDS